MECCGDDSLPLFGKLTSNTAAELERIMLRYVAAASAPQVVPSCHIRLYTVKIGFSPPQIITEFFSSQFTLDMSQEQNIENLP